MALQSLLGSVGFLTVAVALCLTAGASESLAADAVAPTTLWVYVGGKDGIYRGRLDLKTGKLTELTVAAKLANPSFQVIHPGGGFLYSVVEAGRFEGTKGGGVVAMSIAKGTGELTELNRRPSGGAWPCHLTVSPSGRWLLGANYGGGNVFVLPIGADGKLGERTALVQHRGKSVDPKRQTAPHAHSINLDAPGRFAFAADLGLDQVLIYRLDPAKGTLTPHEPAFAATAPGAGPRHLAMHPAGKWAYVINELNSTVAAYAYDADKGTLTEIQTVTTLPKNHTGRNSCAEVQVHPSGKFLYGSNRGHDSIAIFAVDTHRGTLRATAHEPVGGKWPRNFRIDPTGAYLISANRHTNNVVVFRIDGATGALKPTGQAVEVPAPSCVKFLAPR